MDLAIDTSSLALLDDTARWVPFLRTVAEGDRLVVPHFAGLESFAIPVRNFALARCRTWRALREALGPRLVLAPHAHELIKMERKRRVGRVPDDRENARILDTVCTKEDPFSHITAAAPAIKESLAKERMSTIDEDWGDSVRHRLPNLEAGDLDRWMKQFRDNVLADANPFAHIASNNGAYLTAMRKGPSRYRTAIAWAGYALLNAIGETFKNLGYSQSWSFLGGDPRGNWVDAMIVATAVSCRRLLSEDKRLRARARFLAQTFGWRVEVSPIGIPAGAA